MVDKFDTIITNPLVKAYQLYQKSLKENVGEYYYTPEDVIEYIIKNSQGIIIIDP